MSLCDTVGPIFLKVDHDKGLTDSDLPGGLHHRCLVEGGDVWVHSIYSIDFVKMVYSAEIHHLEFGEREG